MQGSAIAALNVGFIFEFIEAAEDLEGWDRCVVQRSIPTVLADGCEPIDVLFGDRYWLALNGSHQFLLKLAATACLYLLSYWNDYPICTAFCQQDIHTIVSCFTVLRFSTIGPCDSEMKFPVKQQRFQFASTITN